MRTSLRTNVSRIALLFLMLQGVASAQGNISWAELWRNNTPPASNPTHPNAWMTPSNSFTSIAYDKWRDVLYVVNPGFITVGQTVVPMPRIYAWDANTGLPAMNIGRSAAATAAGLGGELPVPIDTISPLGTTTNRGFSQNMFSLYKIDLDDEGRIYACNLVAPLWGICVLLPSGPCDPVYLSQGPFRVWRWDNPTATPVLAYATLNTNGTAIGGLGNSEQTFSRWGDAFDVIGKRAWYYPVNDAPYLVDSVRIYVSGGSFPAQQGGNGEVNVILPDTRPPAQRPDRDVAGGGKLDMRLAVRLVNSFNGLAGHGVAATGGGLTHDVWMDSNTGLTTVAPHVQHPTNPWPQTYNQPAIANRSLSAILTGPSGPIKYFETTQYNRKFLAVADGFPSGGADTTIPNNNTTARVLDISQPGGSFIQFNPTPKLGDKTLGNVGAPDNYIADIDYQLRYYSEQEDPDAPGTHIILFVLMSNNGIAAYRSRGVPVEFTSFAARINGEQVYLTWDVALEANNHGFEMQRSFNGGENWEVFGFVAGRGTTTQPMKYSYTDHLSSTHRSVGIVKYRIRQIDHDGADWLSPILDVYIDAAPTSITLYRNYPNPFNPSTTIGYQLGEAGHVLLTVFNALGERVAVLVDEHMPSGAHQVILNSEHLPSGTYIYQIQSAGATSRKKMTLIR